jgi:ribosomal protein S27E
MDFFAVNEREAITIREPFELTSFTMIRCRICGLRYPGDQFFILPSSNMRCPTCGAIDERSLGARLYNFIISGAWEEERWRRREKAHSR